MSTLAETLCRAVLGDYHDCDAQAAAAMDWFAARLADPAVVEAVASVSLFHGTCHTQGGTSARPVMCRCGTAVETFGVWHRHRATAALAAITTALSGPERGAE